MSDEAVYQTYKPKPCQGDDSIFTGEVVLKLPTYDESLEFLDNNPEIGDEVAEDDPDKASKGVKRMLVMAKWCYQFIHKVDIKRKSDGKHFTSLSELKVSKDCRPIIQDIALQLASGSDLGK